MNNIMENSIDNNVRKLTDEVEKDRLVLKFIHAFDFYIFNKYNINIPNPEKENHIDKLSATRQGIVKAANVYGSDYRNIKNKILSILEEEGFIKIGANDDER